MSKKKSLNEAFGDYILQDLYDEGWESAKELANRFDEALMQTQYKSNNNNYDITHMAINYRGHKITKVTIVREPEEMYDPEIHNFSKSVSYKTVDEFLNNESSEDNGWEKVYE